MLEHFRRRLRTAWQEYPVQFWVLFVGMLVNATGIYLIFPFISLYLTGVLHFSMTAVGFQIAGFWVASMLGQVISGELVDRVGCRPVMLIGLYLGAFATLVLGLVGPLLTDPGPFHVLLIPILILLLGLSSGLFYPAANTMTADLIGGTKRTQAYGLLRVVYNLGIAIGPGIGGLIASQSYLVLFISAAVALLCTAVMFTVFTQETRPANRKHASEEDDGSPLRGHMGHVFRDTTFVVFNVLYAFSMLSYAQMNTTLPVYLQNYFDISEAWYGAMMSLNAAMVVVLQYPLSHYLSRFQHAWCGMLMAAGAIFFGVGFGLFGFVTTLPLFFLGQAIWTVGEMITTPVSQAFVADVAPQAMRGRYMGFYGLSWGLAYGLGPLLGSLVLDHTNGAYIWYGALGINALVATAYILYNRRLHLFMEERRHCR